MIKKKRFKALENCHLALASCSNQAFVVAIHKNNVVPVGGAKVVDNKLLAFSEKVEKEKEVDEGVFVHRQAGEKSSEGRVFSYPPMCS